nr:uncharacterized protein LOC129385834 [Dermacentor andersoni]
MSNEISKKSERRRRHHHRPKKTTSDAPATLPVTVASSTAGSFQPSPASLSGLVSPVSGVQSPVVRTSSSAESAIAGQPAMSSGSATLGERASPGGGSGGHPGQGGLVPATTTSTSSGTTAAVQTPKPNGEQRTQQRRKLKSERGTTQAKNPAMHGGVTSAVAAARSSIGHEPNEPASAKDRDRSHGRAPTGYSHAGQTRPFEPSKGTCLLKTITGTMGIATSTRDPTAGVVGHVQQVGKEMFL